MKKNTTLIILFLFPYILSASDWKFIEKLPSYVSVLTCPSADCCYSLIYDSSVPSIELFKSSDHGKSWFSVYKRTPIRTPRRACSPLPDHFYILQWDKSEMLKSIDGGITFKEIIPEPEKIMLDLIMYNENIGVARIHTNEYLYITYDGWETLEKRKLPDSFVGSGFGGTLTFRNQDNVQLRFVEYAIERVYLVNYNLERDEWKELFEFKPDSVGQYPPNLHKIIYLNDTLGFIAASRYLNLGDRSQEIVFRTTDGGHNWHKSLDTGYTKPLWEWGLWDIDFYDEKNGMAVGKYGTIFFTNNGGDSWVHSEWHGDIFKRGGDAIYGPVVMFGQFAGQFPIIGTRLGGNMYRYEGDFFIFDFKAPDLFFPKQNTVKHEQDIQFRWEELRDATSYSFRLATDHDFNDIVKEYTANEMNTNYGGLDYFTEYYWQVSSSNGEETMWSDVHIFRTCMPDVQTIEPLCFSEQYPRNMKFDWTAVKGAENYRLRLATNQNFTENLILIEDLEVPSYEIEVLESITSYFWQVQAYRSDETGDWSELCSFTTTQDTVSVRDLSNAIKIYPNPTKDKIYIQTTIFLSRIELSDVIGNVVKVQTSESQTSDVYKTSDVLELKVESLPAGTYFLKLYTMSSEVLVEKVIVGF